jgi:hypothetical protein
MSLPALLNSLGWSSNLKGTRTSGGRYRIEPGVLDDAVMPIQSEYTLLARTVIGVPAKVCSIIKEMPKSASTQVRSGLTNTFDYNYIGYTGSRATP